MKQFKKREMNVIITVYKRETKRIKRKKGMKKEWQEERKKKEREKNKTKGRKMEENTDRKTDKRLDGQSNYVKIMFTCFWVFVVISVSRVFLAKCFDISANWSKQGKYHYKEIGIKRNQPLPCNVSLGATTRTTNDDEDGNNNLKMTNGKKRCL